MLGIESTFEVVRHFKKVGGGANKIVPFDPRKAWMIVIQVEIIQEKTRISLDKI